jgi:metallophosphoesterase (TIGR03767 family)
MVRTELGAAPPGARGACVLALALMSDVQVLDTVSPARCEWVAQLSGDPLWAPLQPMHRPYEALTHWALAAHVARLRKDPTGPCSARPFDLALSLGDNIDNAQQNELDAFLAIIGGGRTWLSAFGGVQDASAELGDGPWPFWCPDPAVADLWKPRGYPAIPDFLERASAELVSPGLGFAWTSVAGNHDWMRQGTALPEPEIEAIARGSAKSLRRPAGLDPADPLALFVDQPAAFSRGMTRQVPALDSRTAVSLQQWMAAHVRRGACGYSAAHAAGASADLVIDTGQVRIILLDTNHPAGDYQGSVGRAQLAWLDERLAEVDALPGWLAILASHHGSRSLTNTRGNDASRRHADALEAVLLRHPSLIAWLVGHRHLHQITPHPGPLGGFWEIATASLIDWPSQTRAVECLRHANGQIEIACTLLDHEAPVDDLAHWHRTLARLGAGASAGHMQGGLADGNVRLMLAPRS